MFSKIFRVQFSRAFASPAPREKSIRDLVLYKIADDRKSTNKVTIVGIGNVGNATALSILCQGYSNRLHFTDINESLLKSQLINYEKSSIFLPEAKITASRDLKYTAGSRVCIITCGAEQKENQSRQELLQLNADIIKSTMEQLVKFCPEAVFIIATNPADVLSFVAWKASGLPSSRVISSGTYLDTSRFRVFVGKKLGIDANSVEGFVIGEHGDSSVPVWSSLSVGGVLLAALNPKIGHEDDAEKWNTIKAKVRKSAYEIIKSKMNTSWAVGFCLAAITRDILNNTNKVVVASTCVKGFHGISDEIYLSLPCIMGANGISHIIEQPLSETELNMLHKSADILLKAQNSVN